MKAADERCIIWNSIITVLKTGCSLFHLLVIFSHFISFNFFRSFPCLFITFFFVCSSSVCYFLSYFSSSIYLSTYQVVYTFNRKTNLPNDEKWQACLLKPWFIIITQPRHGLVVITTGTYTLKTSNENTVVQDSFSPKYCTLKINHLLISVKLLKTNH